MNSGGEPGRDDYGLPPVDAEIPDDARELARDVQAYHRELRALRRRRLVRRFYRPFARDGMVLPMLAGCLALTLLAATLLTVFTARQATTGPRGGQPGAGRPGAGNRHTPAASRDALDLLGATVVANGEPEPVSGLTVPGHVLVLALVPPHCGCLAGLRRLATQASAARAQIYLVGVRGATVAGLTSSLGLGAAHAVEDSEGTLPPRYHVASLAAVLVRADGAALRVVTGPGFQISREVQALARGTASPRPTGPAHSPAA